ncbi:MAG: hypothetical protein IKC03_04640 [Oscillospiraceae bacterium]|nr:hypothetical protein [Oscillospiraceae bacterium]
MAMKGYHSYRGRSGIWRWLLSIVLVLILAAACGFLFVQRYITYSDDGSARLEIPFLSGFLSDDTPDGDEEEKPGQSVNLIIDQPQKQEQPVQGETPQGQEQTPPGAPVPETAPYTSRRLVGLPASVRTEAELVEKLTASSADGFVFTVKDNTGTVHYASDTALSSAVTSSALSKEMLGALCSSEDVYAVARLNCFYDAAYAFANMENAGICQTSGYIWYDYQMRHWMDPGKEAARSYLIQLALECAQMGFDELLLEDMTYPTRGKLYKIDYSKNTMEKSEALVLFLNELRDALAPYGMRISLVLEEDVVTGTSDSVQDSGLVTRQILPLVDTVYTRTADLSAAETAMVQILQDAENRPVLVPVVSSAAAEGAWYLP